GGRVEAAGDVAGGGAAAERELVARGAPGADLHAGPGQPGVVGVGHGDARVHEDRGPVLDVGQRAGGGREHRGVVHRHHGDRGGRDHRVGAAVGGAVAVHQRDGERAGAAGRRVDVVVGVL